MADTIIQLISSPEFLLFAVVIAALIPSPIQPLMARLVRFYLMRARYGKGCDTEIKKRARKPKPKEK